MGTFDTGDRVIGNQHEGDYHGRLGTVIGREPGGQYRVCFDDGQETSVEGRWLTSAWSEDFRRVLTLIHPARRITFLRHLRFDLALWGPAQDELVRKFDGWQRHLQSQGVQGQDLDRRLASLLEQALGMFDD